MKRGRLSIARTFPALLAGWLSLSCAERAGPPAQVDGEATEPVVSRTTDEFEIVTPPPGEATDAGKEVRWRADILKVAGEIADATVEGDFETLLSHTYDSAVEVMGGFDKGVALARATMKQMKDGGVVFRKFEIGEPGDFHARDGRIFVLLPTRVEMTIPNGTAASDSYLLGISTDDGASWKFVDGAGLKAPKARKAILPPLPPDLKLPEFQAPEIVIDE